MNGFFRTTLGLLALLGASSRAAAPTSLPNAMTYVALGDSLTAGFQSGGLTAEDQREAYPALIAQLSKTPFGVPAGGGPGCPPPLGGPPIDAASCVRLDARVRGSNFAVPGAKVADLLGRSARNAGDELTRRLYTLILGPQQTQVQAALKSRPRFMTLWIGGNDVLDAAASGNPAQATPPAQFAASYAALLSALALARAQLVLLTVPDVTAAPVLVRGSVLFGLGLGDASCRGSAVRVAATWVLSHAPVSCAGAYALTPAKLDAIRATVAAYNASIRQLARERGLQVFDVAPLLADLQRPDPDPGSPQPFGPDFSQDGVHLSAAAQEKLAHALLVFGNAHLNLGVALP